MSKFTKEEEEEKLKQKEIATHLILECFDINKVDPFIGTMALIEILVTASIEEGFSSEVLLKTIGELYSILDEDD